MGKQKAPAVSDLGVIGTKLVAVIAQRQRLFQAPSQRLKASEMRNPFFVCQRIEADGFCSSLVAVTQNVFWKTRGRDNVIKIWAECSVIA